MSKRFPVMIFLAACLAFALFQSAAADCGGFFCGDTPVDLTSERIIFAVNKSDKTITAVVGMDYRGEAQDFSWIFPVPSEPKVEVVDPASSDNPEYDLDDLELYTRKVLTEPPDYCSNAMLSIEYDPGEGPDADLERGEAGAYDYTVIHNTKPDEMVEWLRHNGYTVSDDMLPILQHYADQGMYFLAVRLKQDAQIGDISPIKITYKAENPTIPLRLMSLSDVLVLPVTAWIFADTQYVPQNYAHPVPDYTAMHQVSQLSTDSIFGYKNTDDLFSDEIDRIQSPYKSLAFTTEYAQPSSSLPDDIQKYDPLIASLSAEHPYVTRLTAHLWPVQLTLDPVFVPDPSAPDVPQAVDLGSTVDPLRYWGCSSHSLLNPTAETRLPEHTRIDDLKFDVAYPAGWVMSHFTYEDNPVWAFAPKPVTAADIDNFKTGGENGPIFVVNYSPYNSESDSRFGYRRILYSDLGEMQREVDYSMLVGDQQFRQNEKLYGAMMQYARAYQYYADPQLRHTLFLTTGRNPDDGFFPAYIGYPDGWVERWDGVATVTQDNTRTDSPTASLLPIEILLPGHDPRDPASPADLNKIADVYGLTAEERQTMSQQYAETCLTDAQPLAYNHNNGSRGYIVVFKSYVLEVSASDADFSQEDTLLQQIARSVHFPDFSPDCR